MLAGGVRFYLTELHLAPHETRAINLRNLRDAQTPDFKKNKIPAAATEGGVSWIRLDEVPVTGRVVVISRDGGVASAYDCCTCPCPASYQGCVIRPPPPSCLGPHAIMQCSCTATYQSCNGADSYFDETGSATWSCSNASVASFDSTTRGLLHAHAAGSATISASYSGIKYQVACQPQPCTGGCIATQTTDSGSSTCNVQVPYSVGVVKTVVQGAASCASGQAGWSRTVYLQLYDQNTPAQPMQIPLINKADSIQVDQPNPLGAGNTNTGSHNTDDWGQWPDTYFLCSTACPGSAGEADALQYWTANGNPLRHANLVIYKCGSITVNGK